MKECLYRYLNSYHLLYNKLSLCLFGFSWASESAYCEEVKSRVWLFLGCLSQQIVKKMFFLHLQRGSWRGGGAESEGNLQTGCPAGGLPAQAYVYNFIMCTHHNDNDEFRIVPC